MSVPRDGQDALDRLRLAEPRRRRSHGLLIAALLALAAMTAAGAASVLVLASAPDRVLSCDIGTSRSRVVGGDTALTSADGRMLGFVPTALNREPVPLERMSHWLPVATVSIEDRRFWKHGALDPVGIARSAFADVTSHHVVQGASTLTQQLVRNRYLNGRDMTLSRKLTEACLAAQLYRRMTRAEILEAYLNTVFYGHHSRGAQAAAWTYFSRSAARLTLEQAAFAGSRRLPRATIRSCTRRPPARAATRCWPPCAATVGSRPPGTGARGERRWACGRARATRASGRLRSSPRHAPSSIAGWEAGASATAHCG